MPHGGRPTLPAANTNAPQKKTSTAAETAMRCAAAAPQTSEQCAQQPVEEDVGGLARQAQAGSLSPGDQLDQPGIVYVTAQIARLHPRLPVARDQHQNRCCQVSGRMAGEWRQSGFDRRMAARRSSRPALLRSQFRSHVYLSGTYGLRITAAAC